MKKCAIALLCGSALFSAAHAADLRPAYKAPIKAPAPFSWTGFYVGGNVGYGWGRASLDGGVASLSPKGVDGGVQLGYNYEVGQVVFGLEGDFQFADHKDSISASGGGATETLEAKSDWFSTARGRIGFAFDRFLPYVTGGVAFTHTKVNEELTAAGGLFASASADKTSTGYAIGGGLEYAIDRNWSVKGEYLHLGFGSQTYDFTPAGGPAFSVGSKLSFDIARLGVNYRF
ncbi:MAG TPA: outer membrane protein [Pseudolabrys sp.]